MKKLLIILVIIVCTAPGIQAQSKLAHVDSEKVLDNMPSRSKSIAEIADLTNRGSQELKEMETRLDKEYNDYMARRATQTSQMNEYDEGRLQKMQNDMQARDQQIQQILKSKSDELNNKILSTVKNAVALVANRKGLDYVIDLSSTLFARGPDITQEVLAEVLRLERGQ